jgi:outer membrane receptor protein involved in Fe transport
MNDYIKKYVFIFILIFQTIQSMAAGLPIDSLQQDTVRTIRIEEIVVFGDPKENGNLREQPLSVTLLSQENMRANGVSSMKNLTALVPNIFIPDYGSKLTSAIYIRGVGSRMNSPAVGLYVDNIPYIDKSAYDFNYVDIDRIDVLRGPQGTLYGRNTMGGLIRAYTKSPFNYQGTDVRMSAAMYNNYNVSFTHYQHVSNELAFSAGGFYEHAGGFFDNAFLNKKIDHVDAGGGRIRTIYIPFVDLKFDVNLNYEYSDQGGYPYGLSSKKSETSVAPAYNDESGYRRGLMNAGLNTEYSGANFIFNLITGFQHLNDRMVMDEDFSPDNGYWGIQYQHQNTLTEEIVFKSRKSHRWEWITGVFSFYQQLRTTPAVTFKEDGITEMQKLIDHSYENTSSSRKIVDHTLLVSGWYDTPIWGAALYHQSTFNDIFLKNLSLVLGMRIDYEQIKLTYNNQAPLRTESFLNGIPINKIQTNDYGMKGIEKNFYPLLLPKFALKYAFNKGNNIYVSLGRGYRSGGYNIQMFPDIIQDVIINRPDPVLPDKFVPQIHYKPEYSWNYELGTHLTLWQDRIFADITMFSTRIENQQIARFSKSGLGRDMVNAGQSYSYGVEAAFRVNLTDNFSIHANYGYTQATFTNYVTYKGIDQIADYSGNSVPFVPEQTFSFSGQYAIKLHATSFLDILRFHVNYTGIGKIYWTENNNAVQELYGTLNGRICALKGNTQIDLWIRNALNKKYATFYFESFGNGFAQAGKPMQVGIDVRLSF